MSINTEDKARIVSELLFSSQRRVWQIKEVCEEMSIQSSIYSSISFRKKVFKDYCNIILTRAGEMNLKAVMQIVANGGYIENGFGTIGEAIDLMNALANGFGIPERDISEFNFAKAYFFEALTTPAKEENNEIVRIDTNYDGPSLFY